MRTAASPFYVKNQEEIIEKICLGSYQWPQLKAERPSCEIQNLVASLLVEAEFRLDPDEIVGHDFFTRVSDIRKAYPYDSLQDMCRAGGIGKDGNGQYWPCVGSSVNRPSAIKWLY